MPEGQMSDLRGKIAAATRQRSEKFLEEFGPPIDVKVAQCADYSAVLRSEHAPASSLDELILLAFRRGRVLICGRGASGKSALLNRLAVRAAEIGSVPFVIDLSRWDQTATDAWKPVKENARDAFNFLLVNFGLPAHDITDVEFLPSTVEKLFLLDGLNETPGSTADEILAACDEIASVIVGASVFVTDRLVRRNLDAERRWVFAMPMPVEKPEVDRLMGTKHVPEGAEDLLSSPFFLDRAIRGELRSSPLATIRELVESRGKLDSDGVAAAARAAYSAYEIDGSRTFGIARFAEVGRADIAEAFLSSGILVSAGENRVAFVHHWFHDYLASKHVTSQPDLWSFENRHRVLDILTFKANSFDAIAFALELLTRAASGEFLQAVYDWNPYAAGYALAEASVATDDVPEGVRLVILAMLAEKRFDRQFLSTRRAGDALDLLSDADAKKFGAAVSLDALLASVAALNAPNEEFAKWRAFFILKPNEEASQEIVDALAVEDSLIGWTAANVLKRLRLSDDQFASIERAAKHSRGVVRWRAVHVMGGFARQSFIDALLGALDDDPDENVRYGTIRSLLELASRDGDLLPSVVDGIIMHLGAILASPRVLSELARAVHLLRFGLLPLLYQA
jgi:hypothetical protein